MAVKPESPVWSLQQGSCSVQDYVAKSSELKTLLAKLALTVNPNGCQTRFLAPLSSPVSTAYFELTRILWAWLAGVDSHLPSPEFFMKLRSVSIENADFLRLKGEFENLFLGLKSYRDTFRSENKLSNRKISVIEARSSRLHEISGLEKSAPAPGKKNATNPKVCGALKSN